MPTKHLTFLGGQQRALQDSNRPITEPIGMLAPPPPHLPFPDEEEEEEEEEEKNASSSMTVTPLTVHDEAVEERLAGMKAFVCGVKHETEEAYTFYGPGYLQMLRGRKNRHYRLVFSTLKEKRVMFNILVDPRNTLYHGLLENKKEKVNTSTKALASLPTSFSRRIRPTRRRIWCR